MAPPPEGSGPPEPAAPEVRTTPAPAGEGGGRGGGAFFYGGQAVIEGVMMRGRKRYAVAVRVPSTGEIVVDKGDLKGGLYRHRFWKLPLVRGLALLAEQLHLGTRCLMWSASVNAGDMDVQLGRREIATSLAVAVVGSLVLFVGLPLLGAGLVARRSSSFWFVLIEGLIRVALVFGYLSLVGMVRDVRRVFQYHGAEHKTINAFESGWPLEVSSVRRASLLHPRCGTGFLLVVLVVSLVVFSVVAFFHPNWTWLILSRLLGVPLISGVSYECIRLLARYRRNPVVGVLLLPVLYTQKFTTREPEDGMLEVAIAAFNAAREGEEVVAA
jgi:uncharacterized protein YqhQ